MTFRWTNEETKMYLKYIDEIREEMTKEENQYKIDLKLFVEMMKENGIEPVKNMEYLKF